MNDPTTDASIAMTRAALHAVADWVLAPMRHAHDGRIGMRVTPNGFGHDLARIDVQDEIELVVGKSHSPLSSLLQAARAAGVEPGRHSGTYEPETTWRGDEALHVDVEAARTLVQWFSHGEELLDALHLALPDDLDRSPLTLWPEHLDLAGAVGPEDCRVNIGASAGDDAHLLPYLYVGPWRPVDGDEPFWNESWGASLPYDLALDRDAALAFLRRGLGLAGVVR